MSNNFVSHPYDPYVTSFPLAVLSRHSGKSKTNEKCQSPSSLVLPSLEKYNVNLICFFPLQTHVSPLSFQSKKEAPEIELGKKTCKGNQTKGKRKVKIECFSSTLPGRLQGYLNSPKTIFNILFVKPILFFFSTGHLFHSLDRSSGFFPRS